MKLWRDTRGTTLVFAALTLPVLLGVTGLSVEAGLWYVLKRHNQTAADFAAISGALELENAELNNLTNTSTGVYSDICNFAKQDAAFNGFPFASFACGTTSPACTNPASGKMCVNNPPQLGNYAGNANAVEVIVAQKQQGLFVDLVAPNFAANIANRAVAAVQQATAADCMLALQKTGTDITLQGNTHICLGPTDASGNCVGPGTCNVSAASNSGTAIDGIGSANSVLAATIITPGNVSSKVNATLASPADLGSPPVIDPYAPPTCNSLSPPLCLTHSFLTTGMPTTTACTKSGTTWTGNCVLPGASIVSGDTLGPNTQITAATTGKYKGTVTLPSPNAAVHLSPGTYWITDGDLVFPDGATTLDCPACNPATGAGVTIIFTTAQASKGTVGALILGSQANLNINAPNSGTFAGLAIVQDSNSLPSKTTIDSPSTAKANSTETVTGLVYFPDSTLSFQGGPNANGPQCLVLVAGVLNFAGNPNLNTTGCSAAGVPLYYPKTVVLVE